ncbi:MAG: AgmX/PglI C-terminal domain-containing protein [Deltaproteobacteria bacterium]|nr:AgmX/PglI C-terminal domain-containing protein [Deltaproteobacteria bacterium]
MSITTPSLDVVVSWAGTAIAVERLAPGQAFTVGPHGTFSCDDPSIPEPAFALVTHGAGGARLRPAPGMRLLIDGRAADVAAVDLAPGQGSARMLLGALAFEVRFDRAAAVATSRAPRDGRFLAASGAALALQVAVVTAFLLAPAPFPEELPLPTAQSTRAHFVTPARPALALGGRAAAPAAIAASAPERAPRPRARHRPQRAASELAHAALAALGLGGPVDAPLPGLRGGLEGLQAATGADLGAGGLGTRDLGPGGLAGTTVDVGGFRVRPGGPPESAPWGLVAGEKQTARVIIDRDVNHSDGLTREEIQRVITRALPRIKYCYERELGADPDLEGKVTSTFTIAPSGAVAATTSSHTLSRPAVASCVDRVVRSLAFPQPRGGGQVVVTYPFAFTIAGG